VVMETGHVRFADAAERLRNNPEVQRTYLGIV